MLRQDFHQPLLRELAFEPLLERLRALLRQPRRPVLDRSGTVQKPLAIALAREGATVVATARLKDSLAEAIARRSPRFRAYDAESPEP